MARIVKFRGIQQDIGLFDVVAAGIYTTKGGNAAEVINVRGVTASDVAIVVVHTFGTGSRTISLAACGKNRITVTFSDDPVANHKINYFVVRNRNIVGAARRKY